MDGKNKKAQNIDEPLSVKMKAQLDKEKVEQKAANRTAVQKHHANQFSEKKRSVREKRLEYYYRKKAEAAQTRNEKAVQADANFDSSDCRYSTKEAYHRATELLYVKCLQKNVFILMPLFAGPGGS